jgi:tRNA(Ile2) C34 agmatinyltransferase TiaS|tara:strand:+ start:724 stop:900 length:177 start_codon:yes stop_codon:yes gene_type:complete
MKQAHKTRICKQCGKEIDNSGQKLQKRTKYCSNDCAEDYYFDKQLRMKELNLKLKEIK